MSFSPYLDTTAHDAAYQAQLDREGLREAWIDRRAQEISDTLMSPGTDSGLADFFREEMTPEMADLIRKAMTLGSCYSDFYLARLSRCVDPALRQYAEHLATVEADNPDEPDLTPGQEEKLRRSA